MAISLAPTFTKAYFTLALFGGVYLLFVFALTFPIVQRNALYAHNVNPTLWEDLSDVEAFGFLNYQEQPFTNATSDNETIQACHIQPLQLAEEHAEELLNEDNLSVKTSNGALDSVAFNLLASNPNAHVASTSMAMLPS